MASMTTSNEAKVQLLKYYKKFFLNKIKMLINVKKREKKS